MSSSKQTVLIICGGWHTPKSYSALTSALEASNFEVHVPIHPTMNQVRPPNADLYTDTDNIRSYTEDLLKDGRTLLVLMHSYGGQVGTNALGGLGVKQRLDAGLPGGISHLIYMTATATLEKWTMVDMVRQFGQEDLLPMVFDFADDGTCVHRLPKELLVGPEPGIDDAEIEAYLNTLVRWNGTCMSQPLGEHAAWRDILVTYLHATKDLTVPMGYQEAFVEQMRSQGVKVRRSMIETGHCPNLTAVNEVVEAVKKLADGEVVDTEWS